MRVFLQNELNPCHSRVFLFTFKAVNEEELSQLTCGGGSIVSLNVTGQLHVLILMKEGEKMLLGFWPNFEHNVNVIANALRGFLHLTAVVHMHRSLGQLQADKMELLNARIK